MAPARLVIQLVVSALAVGGALSASQSPAPRAIPAPQGSHTENGLAGFAKILCSGVFVSGRAPEEVASGSAYFFMPRAEQDKVKWTIDRDARAARASLGDITREARYYGDQGCIIQNPDKPGIRFTPVAVRTALPSAATQRWPMGDRVEAGPLAAGVDRAKLDAAVEAAFADPAALTAAFLVLHKGRIVAERYAPGITRDTQLESWSMGKSLAATLFALLVKDGTYTLEQPAPVPLWQQPGDPRAAIRNIDLLRMSAGLKFLGNQEPGSNATYPDHYYIYTGAIDAFEYSITRPQEYPPNTDGRYRNSDPLTITYLTKLAVTRRGENFLTWPQRALFDRIGIRKQVLETDPYGNFLITGYDYGTARNWARIGLLYLQDGVWQGERLLPEGWSTFVSTPAPAWKRPEYGGFFWLNRLGTWNLPPEAYFAAGAGGQNTWIVPSQDLVIVRMGHMRGQAPARRATNAALGLVMEAIRGVSPGSARGQPGVSRGSARGQPGVSPGSARGQPGVSPGSARGQPGVSPGSAGGQPGVSPGSARGQTLYDRSMIVHPRGSSMPIRPSPAATSNVTRPAAPGRRATTFCGRDASFTATSSHASRNGIVASSTPGGTPPRSMSGAIFVADMAAR